MASTGKTLHAHGDACKGPTNTIHHLACGHTVRIISHATEDQVPCFINCSHHAKHYLTATYINPPNITTPQAVQLLAEAGQNIICDRCLRADANNSCYDTWKALEARLIAENPVSAVWTDNMRFKVVAQTEEFEAEWTAKQADVDEMGFEGAEKGEVWGWQVEVQMEVEELGGLMEDTAEVGADAKVDDLMRSIGCMGMRVDREEELREEAMKMFGRV